jgi:hypothetical protein
MKTKQSQHKLKEQTLVFFSFYSPRVPPFFFLPLNKLELVEVVELLH